VVIRFENRSQSFDAGVAMSRSLDEFFGPTA
jgi:hypothetical protein